MKDQTTEKKPKGLSNSLKYLFGVGDAGFVLMSNVETFYFMTFLTDLAGFSTLVAGAINSVFSIVDACLSWIYGAILTAPRQRSGAVIVPGWFWHPGSFPSFLRSSLSAFPKMRFSPQ